jgi:hypothetical protein
MKPDTNYCHTTRTERLCTRSLPGDATFTFQTDTALPIKIHRSLFELNFATGPLKFSGISVVKKKIPLLLEKCPFVTCSKTLLREQISRRNSLETGVNPMSPAAPLAAKSGRAPG